MLWNEKLLDTSRTGFEKKHFNTKIRTDFKLKYFGGTSTKWTFEEHWDTNKAGINWNKDHVFYMLHFHN